MLIGFYIKKIYPIEMNITINGSNTKNQDKDSNPFLHIKSKTHVQNKTYKTLIANIIDLLVTLQE
jgi:hypothetical protein